MTNVGMLETASGSCLDNRSHAARLEELLAGNRATDWSSYVARDDSSLEAQDCRGRQASRR